MGNKIFKAVLLFACGTVLFIVAAALYTFTAWAFPALTPEELFALIPTFRSFIAGTFVVAGLAVVLSVFFSLAIASFAGEYYRGTRIAHWIKHWLSYCSNIPSIVWGIGAYSVVPDKGVFTMACVLATMIIPYASSYLLVAMSRIPLPLRESAYSLGATPSTVIGKIILPLAGKSFLAVYLLAFVKALGETMIIVVFAGETIAGGLFYSFTTATIQPVWGVLALGLFLVTAGFNSLAHSVLRKNIQ
ncbi:MAG: ABC transporter permease subunit [Dysgonamonadaceae bacterium]|jgi:phosphate transport system permease protein|nr:ABC transporter permease subunit [Dysgonamonadaceae bacterium]